MRKFLIIAGLAAGLAACGGGSETDANAVNDMNAMTADPMATNQDMGMDANAMGANGMGGMDGNTATNAATENAMMNDLTTNDADTNLANGM